MSPLLLTDSDLVALRRAVCAQPAETTPRLVYADRLDELGIYPAWAAVIRTQIATTDGHRAYAGGDLEDLDPGAAALLRAAGVSQVTQRNGFVEDVRFTDVLAFHRHAKALFRTCPLVRVAFDDCRPHPLTLTHRRTRADRTHYQWEPYYPDAADPGREEFELPDPIFRRLTGYVDRSHMDSRDGLFVQADGDRDYSTRAAATKALTQAALAWGRFLRDTKD